MHLFEEGCVHITLAATPVCDGSVSMDLYARDLIAALDLVLPSSRYLLLQPGANRESWIRQQYLRYIGYPQLLRRAVMARNTRVVHILDQSYAHLCRNQVRTVVTCHDIAELTVSNLTVWQLELWKWRVHAMRNASRIVAISHNTARDLRELLGINPERIVVSHSGVSARFKPPHSAPESAVAKRLLGLKEDHFLFLHVGNNAARKNIPVLLRAFAIVSEKHPGAILVKVGDPFTAGENKTIVKELGLVNRVIELGRIPDEALVEVYQSADCLVFPSLYEGFGRPVVEAQACGTPCILARSSSLEEVGGNAAVYHDPRSTDDLANRMSEVLTRETLRHELAAHGISNAARFSCHAHVRTLLDVYAEVSSGVHTRASIP